MNSLNIFSKYFHEIFKDKQEYLYFIFPRKKIHYDKYLDNKLIDCGNKTSYYSIFVCYKIIKQNIFL